MAKVRRCTTWGPISFIRSLRAQEFSRKWPCRLCRNGEIYFQFFGSFSERDRPDQPPLARATIRTTEEKLEGLEFPEVASAQMWVRIVPNSNSPHRANRVVCHPATTGPRLHRH